LLQGRAEGRRGLYITLSETSDELRVVASSHGWDLKGIELFELASVEEVLGAGKDQSIVPSWEVELGQTIELIRKEVERIKPHRVVFDSLSEMRLLAQDPLRYRRQLLSLKQFFSGLNTTVFLVDDLTGSAGNSDNVPSMSRQTRPRAMPNTPWPPRNRSITSSSDVHSKTDTPSLIKVTSVRSATPRARRCSIAVRIC